MWDRREIKLQGKTAFRMNYWKCVLVSLIMGALTASTATASYSRSVNGGGDSAREALEQIVNQVQAMPQSQQIALAAGIAGGVTIIIAINVLLDIFVFNPLLVGCHAFFKENVKSAAADFSSVGIGFKNYMHTFATLFLHDLFIFLWSLLLIIPGIITAYSYRMVPYLIVDHPELSAAETLRYSKEMMRGNKWEAFMLDLSFIGWAILSALTLGVVAIFWYSPYKYNTDAALYLALKKQN